MPWPASSSSCSSSAAQTRRVCEIALLAGAAAVLAVLGTVYALADDMEVTARQQMYRDPIIHTETTPYQDIVVTQLHRLHRRTGHRASSSTATSSSAPSTSTATTRPSSTPPCPDARANVLILGGGDGLALREVLRYDDVEARDARRPGPGDDPARP